MASGKCAHCGADTTLACNGCNNAPEYTPGDAATIAYCNKDCQTKDWPNHKKHCHDMAGRKKILRVAQIVKFAFLAYREAFYDLDVTKVEFHRGFLNIHHNERNEKAMRFLFPNDVTDNMSYKEAALARDTSPQAMSTLRPLVRKLLEDLDPDPEWTTVRIGWRPLPTKFLPGPNVDNSEHCVIVVCQRKTEDGIPKKWIMDPAGAQYGFQEALVPYGMYHQEFMCLFTDLLYPYIPTITSDMGLGLAHDTLDPVVHRDNILEEMGRVHFVSFCNHHINKDMLDVSDRCFPAKLERMVQDLKTHMQALPMEM